MAAMRVFLAALCVALLGGCAGPPLVEGVDRAGRHLVLLLDQSTSMRTNDPDDAARAGVDLTLALAGTRDNVAVVTFAAAPDVRVPLGPAGGAAAREASRRSLDGLSRNGVGDVAAGLVRAREVLEAGEAPRGASIVFLTDGVPYRQQRGRRLDGEVTVEEAVAAIAARGWRIVAIALGAEAATPFLSELVASTGGAVVTARSPEDLVKAFESVAIEALGYLRAERGAPRATVLPGTRRLAFLGHFSGSGSVGAVTRDGAALPEAGLVRTPATGSGPFAVALVEQPEPGAWAAELTGARVAAALLEPSFTLDVTAAAAVEAGAPVEVTARLAGDPAAIEAARQGLTLRGRIELDWAHAGAWVELAAADGVARGTLEAPEVKAEAPLSLVVEARTAEGLTLTRTRALTVRPRAEAAPQPPADPAAAPLAISVEPPSFARRGWTGDRLGSVVLSVRGDPTRAVRVACAGKTLELRPGERGELDVACPEDGRLEVTAEAVVAEGAPAGSGPPVWRTGVRGDVRRWTFQGAPVVLPATPAGVATRPAPVELAVTPDLAMVVSGLVLEGPGGAALAVEQGPDGLVARPPADAPPGRWRGTLEVRASDEALGLRPRTLAVSLDVLPPVKAPDAVALKGDWGWVSRPVELSWPSREEVAVTLTSSALVSEGGARLDPTYDVRLLPLDGWSGETLGLEPRRLAVQVFLSTDLPAGTYRGTLSMTPAGQGPLEIPVQLEVVR